ncbi:MAG: hypothetical protein QF441_02400 [Bacteriovoracaceae bacterium]|jgi:flagellar biosynthesis GTPase FlhF|nr:hypothetical protein [Bacteriovoracaceae bacterium]
MYVKKFEGESLDEALKAVKMELGPDAIILKTVTNKGLKGAFKKSRIEITAAISEQNYEKKAKVDHVLSDTQREDFYQAPASRVNHMINDYNQHNRESNSQNQRPSRGGGYGNMGLNKVVNTVSSKIKSSLDDFLAIEEEESSPTGPQSFEEFSQKKEQNQRAASTQNYFHEEQDDDHHAIGQEHYVTEDVIYENQKRSNEVTSELRQNIKSQKHQIDLLEQKLFELTEKIAENKQGPSEPKGLMSLRTTLRSLELSDVLIQKISKKATFELAQEELEDVDLIYDFALRELNEMINVKMPLFSSADIQESPIVTVLLSENSCGQSSMAMKLAVLQENTKIISFRESKVKNISSDFAARVFKVDVALVDSLAHLMSEARKAIQDGKSIILDLRLNFKEVNESKKFIETLKRSFEHIEFLGTLSAIHSEIYNRKILSKYQSYLNGVIISYVDQCLSFGPLVNVHTDFPKLPLTFFGTGATVPDDIESATAERILAGMFQL